MKRRSRIQSSHEPDRRTLGARVALALAVVLCLVVDVPPGAALVAGLAVSLGLGPPFGAGTWRLATVLLEAAIVGLGAGMNLERIAAAAVSGAAYTAVSVLAALGVGFALGRLTRTDRETAALITAGTAVCGASAIAVTALTMRARPSSVSIAFIAVFLLNAVALLTLPGLGHAAHLSERQFGFWSAVAVQETATVAGAAMQFGAGALEIATTVKLARAVWIIPISLALGVSSRRQKRPTPSARGARRPWFILIFLVVAGAVTWVPGLVPAGQAVADASRHILVLSLFCLGSAVTRADLRAVGVRPLLMSALLWLVVAGGSFAAVALGVGG